MDIHAIYRRISPFFRRKRLARFLSLIRPPQEALVLDLGGTPWIWDEGRVPFQVLMVNTEVPDWAARYEPRLRMVKGDATRLDFPDASFHYVYSNSVIEHLGTWDRQQAFAREARRVGGRLWIQTPARCFPIEPHLLAPFLHWCSKGLQQRLIRWCSLWGWMTRPTPSQIAGFLSEVRLLNFGEMKQLFPDCQILRERLFGLTKSYIAVRT